MRDISVPITGTGIRSILRNSVFLIGGRWFNIAIRFFYVLLLTRFLTPERYGILNYGIGWYLAFMPLTNFGIDVILGREIGKEKGKGDAVVSRTFILRIAACIVAALLCGASGAMTESQPEIRQLLFIFSIALIGRSMSIWTDAVFIAYEKTIFSLKLYTWFRPLEVVIGVFVLLGSGSILLLALVQAASWWLQSLCGLYFFRHLHIRAYGSCSLTALKTVALQGAPIMIGIIFVTWLLQGPLILFRHFSEDVNGLGQFALSMQLFFVICHMPAEINAAALPVLSRAIVRRDGKDVWFVDTMLRLGIILGAFAGIGAFGLGPWFVKTAFGENYQSAGRLLGPVSLLLVPWTIGGTIARTYYAKGHFVAPAACAGIGAVTLVLCMLLFIDTMGALGGVAAAGAGISVWAVCIMAWFAISDGLDLKKAVIKPALISLASGIVYLQLMTFGQWVALPVSWMVLFGGVLISGVISRAEQSELRGALRPVKKQRP